MGKINKYANELDEEQKEGIKQSIIDLLSNKNKKIYYEDEMAKLLNLSGKELGALDSQLYELECAGKVIKSKKGGYSLTERNGMISGILQMSKKGFGFLVPDDGSEDIFISAFDTEYALNGDRVLVRISEKSYGARREGSVERILERGLKYITGTFSLRENSGYGFVIAEDKRTEDIYIHESDMAGAEDGDKVRVVITKYPDKETGLRGRIEEIYGKSGESQAELKAVLHQYDIPENFNDDVLREAKKIPAAISKEETARRIDLREKLIITIDGPDAKDLDDAVSVEHTADGSYVLGVHIADVSHYVKENTALDKEAMQRGCSFYLLDSVIPMLPEELSNGICSLNGGEDRLALSIEMKINSQGDVENYRIFESVICSSARMVYDDVSDMLEKEDRELIAKYPEIYKMICDMNDLAAILRSKREQGGSLDFNIDETHIELDDEGVPVDIRPSERRIANKIIEEFMLAANKTVAEHHFWLDAPFLYRVHEKPEAEKMEMFKIFAGSLGYSLKGSCDNIHPKALQDILYEAEGSEEEGIISSVMLRSMKKADYEIACNGHFGLSFTYYCHFTSPIRRYPDLFIHRVIKEIINVGLSDKRSAELSVVADKAAELSSNQERKSIQAERTIEKKKKVRYMSERIGLEYNGIISGVVNSGFFVELPNTVEGFVSAESLLDDYYRLDAGNYRLVGENSGRVYRLGNPVKITVDKVHFGTDEIDFRIADSVGKRRTKHSAVNSDKKNTGNREFAEKNGKGKEYKHKKKKYASSRTEESSSEGKKGYKGKRRSTTRRRKRR